MAALINIRPFRYYEIRIIKVRKITNRIMFCMAELDNMDGHLDGRKLESKYEK